MENKTFRNDFGSGIAHTTYAIDSDGKVCYAVSEDASGKVETYCPLEGNDWLQKDIETGTEI